MADRALIARFVRLMISTMRWRLALLLALGLVSSLTAGASLVMMVPLLSLVGIETGGGTTEVFVGYVKSALDALGMEPNAAVLLTLNALVMVATALLSRYQSIVEPRIYETFILKQRLRLFEALTAARWSYAVNERASNNLHLLTSEVNRLGDAAERIVSLVTRVLRVLVHLAVALILSPLLTLLVAASGVVLVVISQPLVRLARARGKEVSATYRDLYRAINEHLSGLKTIKAHGLEDRSVEDFGRRATSAAAAVVDVSRNDANVGLVLQVGSTVLLTAIVWVALNLSGVTPAGLILLLYLFARLVPMLTGLQSGFQSLMTKLSAVELLDEAVARFDAQHETSHVGGGALPLVLESGIELRKVAFDYRAGENGSVLHDIDLSVPVGKTIAIVGPSGGGKSTLADLLIGLLSPDQGSVLLDGVELTDADRPTWRRRVSHVSQDVFMFHDSVRYNLLLANPEASDAELWEALDAASAGFVRDLPEGLETVIGDRGVKLSGGERQRLALARALLRRPDLLVLDEATSNLDAINEARVQEAIGKLRGRITLVVIAHRLATVREADVIHVLVDGRIVESGTWNQLAASSDGALRELATVQGMLPEALGQTAASKPVAK